MQSQRLTRDAARRVWVNKNDKLGQDCKKISENIQEMWDTLE